ncbi:MAG: TauD/TfdA family dioxygenase [Pseudonocardiaceae bacterium]
MNRVDLDGDTAAALLECQATLRSFDLVDGVLRPDLAELYRTTVLGVPGARELTQRLAVLLAPGGGSGFAVLECRTVLAKGSQTAALRVITALLTVIATPFRVFDRWPLWKPLTTRLDVEPMRAMGTGYNPMHIDVVNSTSPPDFAALLCIRPDPLGGGNSVVSNLRRAVERLPTETLGLLRKPTYQDGAFFDLTAVGEEYSPFPVLDELPADQGFVRFTAKMLGARDPDDPHTVAARALEHELLAGQERFRLDRGDLIVMNQHSVCHGREALGQGQDGLPEDQRRLLLQTFLRSRNNTREGPVR